MNEKRNIKNVQGTKKIFFMNLKTSKNGFPTDIFLAGWSQKRCEELKETEVKFIMQETHIWRKKYLPLSVYTQFYCLPLPLNIFLYHPL